MRSDADVALSAPTLIRRRGWALSARRLLCAVDGRHGTVGAITGTVPVNCASAEHENSFQWQR